MHNFRCAAAGGSAKKSSTIKFFEWRISQDTGPAPTQHPMGAALIKPDDTADWLRIRPAHHTPRN